MDSLPGLFGSPDSDVTVAERPTRRRGKAFPSLRPAKNAQEFGQLTFSDFARPTIVLDPPPGASASANRRSRTVKLAGWPMPVSRHGISRLVDGLIVLSAVLIFSLLLISSTHLVPSWPVACALGCGVGVIFAFVYRILFRVLAPATPGERLAQLALEVRGPED